MFCQFIERCEIFFCFFDVIGIIWQVAVTTCCVTFSHPPPWLSRLLDHLPSKSCDCLGLAQHFFFHFMSNQPLLISVTVRCCSNDMLLAPAFIFSNCFGSLMTTNTSTFVMFLSIDFWQLDLKLCGVKLFFFTLVTFLWMKRGLWSDLNERGPTQTGGIHQVETSHLRQVCAVKSLVSQTLQKKGKSLG